MEKFRSLKKFFINTVVYILILLLFSCANPTVVTITMPDDEKMNCEDLYNSVAESQKFKRDAMAIKEEDGANMARGMLFWPAMAMSFHNADKAIKAANERTYHLLKIMKEKKCEGVDLVNAEILRTATQSVAGQLMTVREMYKEGDLTKEEYIQAKRKILEENNYKDVLK